MFIFSRYENFYNYKSSTYWYIDMLYFLAHLWFSFAHSWLSFFSFTFHHSRKFRNPPKFSYRLNIERFLKRILTIIHYFSSQHVSKIPDFCIQLLLFSHRENEDSRSIEISSFIQHYYVLTFNLWRFGTAGVSETCFSGKRDYWSRGELPHEVPCGSVDSRARTFWYWNNTIRRVDVQIAI